jgi:hypothetical protein
MMMIIIAAGLHERICEWGILVSCEHIIVMITILVMQAASSENLLVWFNFAALVFVSVLMHQLCV